MYPQVVHALRDAERKALATVSSMEADVALLQAAEADDLAAVDSVAARGEAQSESEPSIVRSAWYNQPVREGGKKCEAVCAGVTVPRSSMWPLHRERRDDKRARDMFAADGIETTRA